MSLTATVLSHLPASLAALHQVDQRWASLRQTGPLSFSAVVAETPQRLDPITYDVAICGGTLGILVGAALAQRGWKVALLERGSLKGREQEWNISRQELQTFVHLGLLTEAELTAAIASQYNPARIQFLGGEPLWVEDVLNVGVDPVYLLETLKQKFLASGGVLLEHTGFTSAIVHPNGVTLHANQQTLTTRLLLDAMGHFSPIVQQARQGKKPDAVCLVVGTCATGFPSNETGDLIVSCTPIQNQCQYFWEAFPARDGRTTYLFTYLDAHPDRPSLETLFDDYFRLLPEYQQVSLDQLQFKRALFGVFPCYRASPLELPWDRIVPIGDSSGSQSPLSFGGFGSMVRHLERLTVGINDALKADALDQMALTLLQPYQPNLSVTWLFQRTMSVGVQQTVAPNQINDVLNRVFAQMADLGDPVLKPFLQDVVQFPALFRTLTKTSIAAPSLIWKILPQVGLVTLIEWLAHYINLATYAALYPALRWLQPIFCRLPATQRYYALRSLDAFKYGSGNDYQG